MNRLTWMLLLPVLAAVPGRGLADPKDRAAALEALKRMNDFVGDWKGTGGPPRGRPTAKDFWTETQSWSWKFQGDDVGVTVKIEGGRHYKDGLLRWLPDREKLELSLTGVQGDRQVFLGDYKEDVLTVDRVDAATKETQRLTMNLAGDGVRLIVRSSRRGAGRTLFVPEYEVACNKVGESLAAKEKKNVCVVTGGLGTMAVAYKGQTYYVCCSGCRDAFNENPEKYIKEFEEAKKKKK